MDVIFIYANGEFPIGIARSGVFQRVTCDPSYGLPGVYPRYPITLVRFIVHKALSANDLRYSRPITLHNRFERARN